MVKRVGRILRSALVAAACVFCLPATAGAQTPVSFDLPAPKLAGEASDWINTDGKPLSFEKGKVYAVEFWTFG